MKLAAADTSPARFPQRENLRAFLLKTQFPASDPISTTPQVKSEI
jgi:hypothetical protein